MYIIHLDENKNKVYHKGKKRYVFNPLSLIWSKDNYYLLCYDDRHDGTSRYRIDKMENVTVEAEPILEKEEFRRFRFGNVPESKSSLCLVANSKK